MAKLYIKRFEVETELPILNHWLELRNHPPAEEGELPSIGYIVVDEENPICVGFLRKCEGNFGILDGLATNPKISGEIRNIAIDALVTKIIIKAQESGLTHLMAWSVDKGTLERSLRHGFVQSPNTLITKDLTTKAELCQ